MNYIEEKVEEYKKHFGSYVVDGTSKILGNWLRATLTEVDRRAREEVVEEMDRCDSCAFNPCEKHKRPITRVETKSDWLRSEIEKLGGMLQNSNYPDDKIYNEPRRQQYGYNCAIHGLITRYKEELKVLTGE